MKERAKRDDGTAHTERPIFLVKAERRAKGRAARRARRLNRRRP